MRRIVIIGAPGSGKTNLGREISRLVGLGHIERDSYNGPDDPSDGMPSRQRAGVLGAIETSSDGWILDGAPYAPYWYESEVYPRANTIVGLDYPKSLVLWRCTRRTVVNLVVGSERLREMLVETYPLRWAWKVHGDRRDEISRLASENGPTVIVLRSPRDTRRWLSTLVRDPRPEGLPN